MMRVPLRRDRHDQTLCAVQRHPHSKTYSSLAVGDRRKSAPSVLDSALSAEPQTGKRVRPEEIALQRAKKFLR